MSDFTQEDVGLINEVLNEAYDGMDLAYWIGKENVVRLEALRDHINALVPRRVEITTFGDEERHFLEPDGTVTKEPFPEVDPHTGEVLPPA